MSNLKNNQARGHWVNPSIKLTQKYRETDWNRKKSKDKQDRQEMVRKAMRADPAPTPKELALRFCVSVSTIKNDLKAIGEDEKPTGA